MEDSWRTTTEIPTSKLSNYPPRRSTGYTTISDDIWSPEDFNDVFGGPPRTILSHHIPSAGCFYEDIFWQPEKAAKPAVGRRGRKLPLFRIPSVKQSNGYRYQRSRQNNGFQGDVFGWDSETVVTSGSRSKTSSSSALSSEELSPLRPAVSGDGYDNVSLFASKLRPINVKCRWDSSRNMTQQTKLAAFSGSHHHQISISENDFLDTLKDHPFRFSQKNEFGESVNLEHTVNMGLRVSPDHDLPFNSPASVVSSLSQSEKDIETEQDNMEQDEEEDDLKSSYVIEINSCYTETACEPNGVDEAIAWAKETFQKHHSEEKPTQEMSNEHHRPPAEDEQEHERATNEETSKIEEEIELVDERIKLWSSGKEADIRMILSTLHHILWPNSGWVPISTKNLIESSQVKKAYQKAVLCLHPDKLQQRAATLSQKCIAEKAFSALQVTLRIFCSLILLFFIYILNKSMLATRLSTITRSESKASDVRTALSTTPLRAP